MDTDDLLASLRGQLEDLSLQLAALSQSGEIDAAAAESELLAIEAAALSLATRASVWRSALSRERSRWPTAWRQAGQNR